MTLSLNMPDKSNMPAGVKMTMRMIILTFAILALIGTMAYAQTARPAPVTKDSITKDGQDSTMDADKKRVRDRWESLPVNTAKKGSKTDKPGKPETTKPSDTQQ